MQRALRRSFRCCTVLLPGWPIGVMWGAALTVALCASPAGGFDIPFARQTFSRVAQLSRAGSKNRHSSGFRRRRRHSTTPGTASAVMMAGPNQGKPASFFADWPTLEAEVKAYLAEREAGVAPSEDGKPRRRDAVLEFLSVDPVKMALEGGPQDVDQYEGEVNILSYSELTRFGYDYLIEPMMAIGGYTAVSERMGIALNERTLKDREYYEIRGMKLTPQKVEIDGFLTLGRARDERLESVADVDREEKRKDLFSKQAMMDKDARSQASEQASKSKMLNGARKKQTLRSNASIVNKNESGGGSSEESFRAPGLPEELKGPTAWQAPTPLEGAAPPQPLLLNLPQRVYAVAVVACCALAYGHGTSDALERGYISSDIPATAETASLFLVGLNIVSAVLGASIAKNKNRSVPLWAFKGSLAGITSVLELKGLPDIVLSRPKYETGDDAA